MGYNPHAKALRGRFVTAALLKHGLVLEHHFLAADLDGLAAVRGITSHSGVRVWDGNWPGWGRRRAEANVGHSSSRFAICRFAGNRHAVGIDFTAHQLLLSFAPART